jgi:glycine/D-amino acid oxidase-like deaminating enzyme
MQSPIDPVRLLGRHSRVQTTTGNYEGTIVAAGVRGVDLAGESGVLRLPASEVLTISVN